MLLTNSKSTICFLSLLMSLDFGGCSDIEREEDEWQFQQSNVCFKSKGNHYGAFTIKQNGILNGVKLIHRSGDVTCKIIFGHSNWGCDGDEIYTVVTDDQDTVLFPSVFPSNGHFTLPPYTSNSDEIVFDKPSRYVVVSVGTVLRLWYGEDLLDSSELDNGGETCADVYANITETVMSSNVSVNPTETVMSSNVSANPTEMVMSSNASVNPTERVIPSTSSRNTAAIATTSTPSVSKPKDMVTTTTHSNVKTTDMVPTSTPVTKSRVTTYTHSVVKPEDIILPTKSIARSKVTKSTKRPTKFKAPKIVKNSRVAISKGSGFYLDCGYIDRFSATSLESCFKHCLQNGNCRSLSFATDTSKCFLSSKVERDASCTTVKGDNYLYFEIV